ncbi:MAG: hypothetical protein WCW25_00120 [Patescibacteria group bacterium]|jgi:hypothetical protein
MENESKIFESSAVEALENKKQIALEKIIGEHVRTAKEALDRVQGALVFFKLGLELGRENPEIAEKIISEIFEELRIQEVGGQKTLGGMRRSIIDE